jgi:pimeloyl-ACP methyl ester carboxylesterase
MEGVGHALFVDAPAKFNEVLEEFLDGLNTPPSH